MNTAQESLKPYGPSNWRERGSEARMIQAPGRDKKDVLASWTACDLMREQAREALAAGENSPDAWFHLAELTHDLSHWRDAESMEAFNSAIAPHKDKIAFALKRFTKVPREEIEKRLTLSGNAVDIATAWLVELGNDNYKATPDNRDLWIQVSDALRTIAEFQDRRLRQGLPM
ncbi:hypothetical protein JXD20_02735 [Candidatus Peregrinibacteria bacterium]|nr:hypothetical protein [Candidatus Peregrinibacteria bacterium]